jgi:hypothetical protein
MWNPQQAAGIIGIGNGLEGEVPGDDGVTYVSASPLRFFALFA